MIFVVGHKGLRALFGDKFNSLLDLVWNKNFAEIDKLAKTYLPDVMAARINEKAGGEAAPELTEAQRRYLTEEYLAHLAESDVKPSWWREFLQSIKMGLRKLPGLRDLRVTDREIEAMLARSARAMRRGTKEVVTASGMRFQIRPAKNGKEARAVLRELQGKGYVNAETGIESRLSRMGVDKITSNKAIRKSVENGFRPDEHYQAAANIDRLYEDAVLLEEHADKNASPDLKSIKRFGAPFYVERIDDFAEAYMTVKESVQHGHHIYSLELDEIKMPSSADKEGLENQADTSPFDGNSPSGTLSKAIADQNSTDGNSPSSILNKGFEAPRPHDGYYNLQQKIEKARAENKKINKPDAPGQVSTDSGATQGAPTFSRRALGAGLQYNIQQNDGNVNPEAAGSQENADGIRFSLAEYSEADRNSLVEIIRPFVGREMDKSDAEYLKFFQDRGYPVHTEAWAHAFALERTVYLRFAGGS